MRRWPSLELFDLKADPGERTNLLPGREKAGGTMARILAAWRRRPGAEGDQAPETHEALRALGYVQ